MLLYAGSLAAGASVSAGLMHQAGVLIQLMLYAAFAQLQTKLVDVNGSLKGYESLPGDEEAAEKEIRSLLNLVEHSYCNVCLNVAGVDESRAIREAMKMAMRDAERRYVQKQVRNGGKHQMANTVKNALSISRCQHQMLLQCAHTASLHRCVITDN
jgi:hypothetical protein